MNQKEQMIMALYYDKKELIITAKKAIKENNLFFVEDIIAWLPCGKTTFYEYFPADSDEMNDFKAMLDENKIKTKSAIRAKLFRSDKAGELLALYRLICDSDERRMLNQQYIEMEAKDNSLTVNFVGVDKNKKK